MKQNFHKKPSVLVIGLKGLPAFGGAATVGENVLDQLKDQYSFTVLSIETHADKDFLMGDVRQVIFKKFPLSKLNVFVYYIKCALYALWGRKYDLVHLHHTDGAFILPLLKLRYKVVVTSHARPQEHAKWSWWVNYFFTLNEKIAFKMADQLTAVSLPLKQAYEQDYQREIVFIPNGVDIHASIGKGDLTGDEEPYILFAAGRIIPSKGLHILLRTLQTMNVKTKVKVVGNLEQIPAYKKQILSLSEGLDVEFVGLIKNKVTLLNLVAKAQLFVYPTLYEAMSIMLLEAASVRVPIICSDIPANTAVFSNEEVSLFVSEDIEDLRKKIDYFYEHKTEALHKAQKAFEKLEKSHSWATIATQYKDVFASLM